MSNRKITIFVAIFLVVLALLYGVYYFFISSSSKTNTNSTGGTTLQQFNPFGTSKNTAKNTGASTNTTTTVNTTSNQSSTNQTEETVNTKFTQLTDFPVAGATFFQDTRPVPQVEGATTNPKKPQVDIVPSLRYVERVTGHIDERYLDTKVVGEVSNSTIPNIYESLFDDKASTVIYRYLSSDNSIESFITSLGGKQGSFLPPNVTDVSISQDKKSFFYLVGNPTNTTGTIQTFADGKKNQLFTSSYDEWLSQWATNNVIFLTTKASGAQNGYLYSLSTKNGSLKKVFGPVIGLTTNTNPLGTIVLYSNSFAGGVGLGLLDIAKHTTKNLALSGLAEKCIWSGNSTDLYCAVPTNIPITTYPDAWYQGIVSFTDHFVKINTQTGDITDLGHPETSVDGTKLFLDDKDTTLFFINKKDSTLWSLDLR